MEIPSISDSRASVRNYKPTDERERKIHGYMKEHHKNFVAHMKTQSKSKALLKAKQK